MGQHLNFQHSFWNVIQELTYHCIWAIISVAECYSVRLPNKLQLMHTFLHFVVSLQSRFYTLALIFVFDVNIYSQFWFKPGYLRVILS
jgi:hypothetical protein